MGRHSEADKADRPWAWVAGVVVAILIVALGISVVVNSRGDAPSASESEDVAPGCAKLLVATTEEFAPTLRKVADGIADPCRRYDIQAMEPQTFAKIAVAKTDVPDVWIPDSPLWQQSVTHALQTSGASLELRERGSVASSPALIAVPQSLATDQNTGVKPYLAGLGSLPLAASAPSSSTPTALTYVAVYRTLEKNPLAAQLMSDAFFQVVRASVPPNALFVFADKSAEQARAFPASEQQVFHYNAEHKNSPLATLTPESGAPMLQYTYVDVGEHNKAKAATSASLLKALGSKSAKEDLMAAGFRTDATKQPPVAGVPLKLPGETPEISLEDFDRIRLDWNRIARDLRMLITVDVSGSMKREAAPGRTRADLAVDAVSQSLNQMQPASQAGLWVFSTDQQPGGVDYRQIMPVAPLGAADDPNSQRAQMVANAQRIPTMLQGDTGLYDTIWAAYQDQQRTFQPGVESMVVVVTDAKNDDPNGGLTAEQLIANLQGAQDPNRPVRLVLIGMGPDTDVAAMQQVTNAVEGTTAVATDLNDIVRVFADAVWTLTPGAWD